MLPKTSTLLSSLLALALLSGCGWPRVHKVVVQQGNVITQEMIDKLKPGMTRTQVAYIMGEPVVRNTFNDSRWDYVYTLENPGRYEVASSVTLFFESEKLAYFSGDLAPTSAKPPAEGEGVGEGVGEGKIEGKIEAAADREAGEDKEGVVKKTKAAVEEVAG